MKRNITFRRLGIVAALAAYLGGPSDALAQTGIATLYEGARLIVGNDSAPIENSAFVVENGRFTRIGTRGEIQAPAGAARVNLTGKTVMPAIVNTHYHVGPGRGAYLSLSPQAQREEYIRDLHRLAYVGQAAVASMGWDLEAAFQVRAEYYPNAARLLTGGRGASAPLGQVPATIAAYEAGEPSRMGEALSDNTTWLWTETQARIYVQEQAAKSADFIKLWVDSRLGMELSLSPSIYETLIMQARKHHIPVYAHIFFLEDAKGVVRAGVDMLAHPVRDVLIDDEFVQLMKDNRPIQQTNIASPWDYTVTQDDAASYWEDPLFLEVSSPGLIQRLRERGNAATVEARIHEGQRDVDGREFNKAIYERVVSNTTRLYEEGVALALGTDVAGGPFRAHKEMELLVTDVGLTPAQVIAIATRNAAEALGLTDLGTVESGKAASFIVLDANPLDDITNTRRIADVYLQGHRVDREMIRSTYLP